MPTPEVTIDLEKIAHNIRTLKKHYETKGVHITGVTKVVCGDSRIANILRTNGLNYLADSRITNIERMKCDGVEAKFLLLRTLLSEVESVVKYADMSLNSELSTIQALSKVAIKNRTTHKIILMIELGDLREGVLPIHLNETVRSILKLEGIELAGVGTNLACFGGVKPDVRKMQQLSTIANDLEKRFHISLPIVSGGNSANYHWFERTDDPGRINNLRIGESIFLGSEPLEKAPIPHLFLDAFTLCAEVIESGVKPSIPYGEIGLDAFGNEPVFEDYGHIQRAILGIGKQDVRTEGLTPPPGMTILGASSDHLILNTNKTKLKVGDTVAFDLNYGSLLSVMNSTTVAKRYVQTTNDRRILPNGRGKRHAPQATFP
ncbi:MAG: alanine/ornithine racemase family PLP-dependent enzyme [Ekhidna sp.]